MIYDGLSNLRNNLASFINSQNILGTTAGVIIAIAAGDMIRSFVRDIIFPSMYYLLSYKIGGEFSPIDSSHVTRFGKEVISFIFILILTYFFIKNILQYLFEPTNNMATNTQNKNGNQTNTK